MAIMLGGWSSRNKYAIISAARVVSQNVAYEIPMLLVVITMIMVTGTMDLNEIVRQQAGGFWHWNLFRWDANPLMPVTFLIFYICMLAETNRAPFDMAEAESELVAGAYTEYSGMGFGVFFMAEYANILLGCSVATVLFLGGWQSPFGIWSGWFWFLPKMYFLVFSVIWIRWTFPRTQFYGLLNLVLENPHPGVAVHADPVQRDDEDFLAYEERLKGNRQRIQQPGHGHENHARPVLQAGR